MITTLSTNHKSPINTLKLLSIIFILFLLSSTATAQFKENHKYVLGGSVLASNDLDFANLRVGKVLPKGGVLGLSIYANQDALTGITGWFRLSKELATISLPVFFKMDAELGYFEDDSIAAFVSPGFTVPITKRVYLDLSVARLQFLYRDDLETFISINNIGLGLVIGI